MRSTYIERAGPRIAPSTVLVVDKDRLRRLTALTAIVALAAALRFLNLSSLGYANSYYAATVKSMLQSWHNFFFVAAEPGGSVSVDKPPVGFWLQAISAHFLGVNSLGLILPQIVAGLLSVILVYHLVRRSFGTMAGLIAALALAITPVVVATDRNNTIDSTLILTLLLAAWAFIVATERGKLRHLLLGAALVGIGFNIKMMQAYLPLPALYALYFLGSRHGIWRKVGNLAIASVLLVVISLSWATIVDLTPANQRPYVGSSGDNSELNLAIGYNGVERLLGMGNRGSLLSGLFGGSQGGNSPTVLQPGQPDASGAFPQPPAGTDGGFAQRSATPGDTAPRLGQPPQGQGGPGGGVGMFNTGQPGPLRLFTGSLGKDIGWLLPFGLFAAALLAFRARPRWPISRKHQALVLWGGWLITEVIFFSIAGFFHEYYLSMLGAPLAALAGIGAMELWAMHGRRPWVTAALLIAAVGGTVAVQAYIARSFVASVWWLPPTLAVLVAGGVLLAVAAYQNRRRIAVAGFSCVIAAILIAPGIWSGLTSMDPVTSQMLPAAYAGQSSRGFGGMSFGQPTGQSANQSLLSYLESHTQGTKYLVAVPSSQQGADLVLATGRPVLYIGGFGGQDKVVTPSDLTKMVADGELRYILWGGGGPGPDRGQSDISSWIAQHGTPVQGFATQTQSAGGQFRGPEGMQGTLYELSASSVSG